MVDYVIFLETEKNHWDGFHHVKNASCLPRKGEYITFIRDGQIYKGQRVIDVDHHIDFKKEKTGGGLEIEVGEIRSIHVKVANS